LTSPNDFGINYQFDIDLIHVQKTIKTIVLSPYRRSSTKTCGKCIDNVNKLLESSRLLLNNGKDETGYYALGLYLYAIEEYGKAQLLKGCFTGNKKEYLVPAWIFGVKRPPSGRTSHDEKIDKGFKNLPFVCKKLSKVLEIRYNNSTKTQTFMIRDKLGQGSVSVGPFASGMFEDTSIPSREIDFDLKTACFYVDWDDIQKKPKFTIPAIDSDQLIHNIGRFQESARRFNFNSGPSQEL
jgi:AbiV family abortive infection protein